MSIDDRGDYNSSFALCAVELKRIFRQKNIILLNYNLTPLDMYNGLSQVYGIISGGRNHQNKKG